MSPRLLAAFVCALWSAAALAQSPAVTVEPPELAGSRALEKTTEAEVIRDTLRAWDSLGAALGSNQPALLQADFIGTALEAFTATAAEQAKLGIRTEYRVLSHNLRFVFYSPEGQSIELTDNVAYEQKVYAGGKPLISQRMNARYLVVLTPAEVRWKVRLLQAEPAR